MLQGTVGMKKREREKELKEKKRKMKLKKGENCLGIIELCCHLALVTKGEDRRVKGINIKPPITMK